VNRKSARHKLLRRKYKRYAAAVAGAAIISGALAGMPVSKAIAAENSVSPSTHITQTASVNKDAHHPIKQVMADKANTVREHKYESSDKQATYRDRTGKDRYDRYDRYSYNANGVTVRNLSSPVDTIKENASVYGFDADRDTFTFLSLSSREASIQVTKFATGERFIVHLVRSRHQDWRIVSIGSLS